jgi:hypothetical protein
LGFFSPVISDLILFADFWVATATSYVIRFWRRSQSRLGVCFHSALRPSLLSSSSQERGQDSFSVRSQLLRTCVWSGFFIPARGWSSIRFYSSFSSAKSGGACPYF